MVREGSVDPGSSPHFNSLSGCENGTEEITILFLQEIEWLSITSEDCQCPGGPAIIWTEDCDSE